MPSAFRVLLTLGWIALALVSSFLTLFLFAFADSPRAGKVAQRMFFPVVAFALAALGAGGWLLGHPGGWWHAPLAYLLAALPPLIVIAVYWMAG